MRKPSIAQAVVRYSGTVVLTFTVAYLLLSVLPFYANGIHLYTYPDIAGSFFDVKRYAPFSWYGVGGLVQGIAMIAAGYIPYASVLSAAPALIPLGLKWNSFAKTEATFWAGVGLLDIASVVLTWQVRGHIIVWLVD